MKMDSRLPVARSAIPLTVDYVEPPFNLQKGEDLRLHVFIDKGMIEVFANDRQAAVAWHDYEPEDMYISLFSEDGDVVVKEITAWSMKSIYQTYTRHIDTAFQPPQPAQWGK